MARVELEDTWIVKGDIETVESIQATLRRFLKREGMTLRDESEAEFRADQGSQFLTRLLGGWFVPAKWLPKTVSLRVKQTKSGVRVQARIEESMGFGFLDPLLQGKYESFFRRWLEDLRSELPGQSAAPNRR